MTQTQQETIVRNIFLSKGDDCCNPVPTDTWPKCPTCTLNNNCRYSDNDEVQAYVNYSRRYKKAIELFPEIALEYLL